MSNPEIFRGHDSKAFRLSLARGESCCHTVSLQVAKVSFEIHPSGSYCDPIRDLLLAAAELPAHRYVTPGNRARLEHNHFAWHCEPDDVLWKFRPTKLSHGFRLSLLHRDSDWHPYRCFLETVLDRREFIRQIWSEACALLREGGIAYHGTHASFPFREFLSVHEMVTGDKLPGTLSEELEILKHIALPPPLNS